MLAGLLCQVDGWQARQGTSWIIVEHHTGHGWWAVSSNRRDTGGWLWRATYGGGGRAPVKTQLEAQLSLCLHTTKPSATIYHFPFIWNFLVSYYMFDLCWSQSNSFSDELCQIKMFNDALKLNHHHCFNRKCGFIHHVNDASAGAVMNICINLVDIDTSYLLSISI